MDGQPPFTEHHSQPSLPNHRRPGPSAAQNAGINAQIGGIKGQPRVDVTVIRAQDLPRLKNVVGKKRLFFVTVTSGTTTKKTAGIRSVGQAVHWNETLGAFVGHPSSHLRLSIYAMRSTGKDILTGTLEIPFDSLHSLSHSETELSFVLNSPGTTQQPTVYLKIANSATKASAPSTQGADNSLNNNLTVTLPVADSPQDGPHIGIGMAALSTEKSQTEVLSAEKALNDADQAANSMQPTLDMAATVANVITTASDVIDGVVSVYKAWEKAVATMEAVMVFVAKIAEIHPYAKMAWSVLSVIPKTILDQVNRDKNVQTLLQDIHDVFNLGKLVDSLRAIKFGSMQAQIFTAMLLHVCNCGDFIQSYAKNTFWQRIMKSFIGQGDAQIESYRTSLFRLRDLFLNHATVTTEMTALQILDDMEGLSTKLDGISTQIKAVSNQVLDASAYAEKNKKEQNVAPVPTAQLVGPSQAGPSPKASQLATSWRRHQGSIYNTKPPATKPTWRPRKKRVASWSTWHPDTPPPPEPPLMVPDRSSPGLFGPRSRSSPIYDPDPDEPTLMVPERSSPGLFGPRTPESSIYDRDPDTGRPPSSIHDQDSSYNTEPPVTGWRPYHPKKRLKQLVKSWSIWHPDPDTVPTPSSVEPTLLIPERSSPGLFGPRTPESSIYERR